MSYRLRSDTYGCNFWYINPPKTATQSVRNYLETNFKPGVDLIPHPSMRWHATIDLIVNTGAAFNNKTDHFFTTVRNPWARALSYYNYQKKRIEERIIAFSNLEEAELYVKNNPLHVFDYSDKREEQRLIFTYDKMFKTFEQFILALPYTIGDRYLKSLDEFDSSVQWTKAEVLPHHYFTVGDYIASRVPNINLIFPIENAEVLQGWLTKAFGAECILEEINVQGIGNKYRDFYSQKMIEIISEIEFKVINLIGYKY